LFPPSFSSFNKEDKIPELLLLPSPPIKMKYVNVVVELKKRVINA
jgi:hypothetical protein